MPIKFDDNEFAGALSIGALGPEYINSRAFEVQGDIPPGITKLF